MVARDLIATSQIYDGDIAIIMVLDSDGILLRTEPGLFVGPKREESCNP